MDARFPREQSHQSTHPGFQDCRSSHRHLRARESPKSLPGVPAIIFRRCSPRQSPPVPAGPVLGRGRTFAWLVNGWRGLALGRPCHCTARWPSCPGSKRLPTWNGPLLFGPGAFTDGVSMAWLVIGLGMGAGLYDPAFATLGRLYGERGRSAITTLTLFGGFASTVCWPLTAFLDAHLGWRGTCLVYAGLQAAVALPIYLLVLPREPRRSMGLSSSPPRVAPEVATRPSEIPRNALFLLLAVTITLASVISTAMSVHLLTILQAKGLTLAATVSLGALVGPSQVAARTIEMLIGRFHHPIWTKVAATSLVAVGLAALFGGGPIITLALVLYGAGIGLESIARGSLPLALYGPERYPIIIGRIAMPSLIAQAAAPSIGALMLGAGGPDRAWRISGRRRLQRAAGSRPVLILRSPLPDLTDMHHVRQRRSISLSSPTKCAPRITSTS